MKAEVITIFDNNNYGSMLQTYATQTLLARYGVEAEFVDYIRPHMTDEAKIQERLKKSKYSNLIALWLIRRRKAKALKDASSIFRGFLKDKINLTDRTYYSFEEICKNPPAADFYCTGSDQTWNSSWNQGIDRSFFLSFAPEEKPKISFSASVGKTDISDDERDEMVRLWKQYACITVREESAEKLLRSVGIEAHTVLDPTLMLTKAEWERIASQRVKNEPYILVYQLHRKHQYVKFEDRGDEFKKRVNSYK